MTAAVIKPELEYRPFWLVSGYLLLIVILVLSLIPLGPVGDIMMWTDKFLHAGCFLFLMIWFCGLFPRSSHLRISVLLMVYGGLIELLQYLTGFRSFELADMVADVVGILFGAMLASLGLWRWCEYLEKRIIAFK
ncbi:MAG: VanZ family protein [Gammaproteobacteria bacterium]